MSFPPPPHHTGMPLPGLPPLPPSMVPSAFHFPPMATMMPMGLMTRPMMPPGMPTAQLTDNRMMNPRGHMPRKPIIPRRMDEINRVQINQGPTITVFVGNITERAADNLVKQLLMKCGNMVSWKRVQGASGKLQAFGFCEYGDPESALRAIRILHEWELGDKKLVVKVDAKTKEQLDEYKANKRRTRFDIDSAGSKTPTESERDDEDELDEETKKDDSIVRTGIQVLLKDYEYELSRSMLPSEMRKKARQERAEEDKEAKDNLDEMDLEEDKKNLIHREIDKFRDTMKKLEEEKEKEKERREKERERRDRERERDHHRRDRNDGIGSGSMSNRLHGRSPERTGARSRDHVVNNRSRSRSREREREREHERSREKERERENFINIRDKEIDRDKREKDKEREREEEEEAYERRKLERKIREKDATYQERLRNWEARERKKAREYEKYKEKEEEKRSEEMKEARRLKEFLEDYDDERDDPKYYKSNALLRRMKDREKEIENDNRDRQKEKEELEELRLKLLEEGHPDPNAELERIKKETEEKFKPLVKSEVIKEEPVNVPAHITCIDISESKRERKRDEDKRPSSGASTTNNPAPAPKDHKSQSLGFSNLKLNETNNAPPSNKAPPSKEESANKPKLIGFSGLKLGGSPVHPQSGPSSAAIAAANRKKKLTVGEVFNMDEDESSDGQPKKRKLVPLDYTEDEKKAVNQTGSGSTSQEEKRKHIKNLIDKIPTEKDKLFEYVIDWSIVDNVLMERRIRPWINKKIVEYIGEEEPTLVDFICSKLMVGSAPQSILDDVQMVLDDEAEVFVVKMWRLLIYEIEAKKLGLVK